MSSILNGLHAVPISKKEINFLALNLDDSSQGRGGLATTDEHLATSN